MKRLIFKCTLKTDVIISAQTATEGGHQSLNFIPGSNFLGILASSLYNKDTENSYILFHSGKVRFGDAHIVINKKRSFQIPFSWYYPKGGKLTEDKNYMLNFMSNENFIKIVNNGIILKQARDGYFTEDGKYLSFVKTFSQKTAYDSDKRRSAESEMFGYEALQKGSEWQFCIDVDDDLILNKEDIIEELKTLVGTKRLGRSKTAEFGSALIELIKEYPIKNKEIEPQEIDLEQRTLKNGDVSYNTEKTQLVFLYAESRLVFRNRFGQPTFTPSPEQLGLPIAAKVLWKRSQIRTGIYAPWNYKRDCRDEDRVFIEKGSVFVVDVGSVKGPFTDEAISKGVGLYRTDGFGKLLINPGFLDFDSETGELKLQLDLPDTPSNNAETEVTPPDADLIKWIEQQNDFDKTLKLIDDFMKSHSKQYRKVTNSQWGNIRSDAGRAANKADLLRILFEVPGDGTTGGSLTHGVALEQWKDGKELLKKTIEEADKEICLLFIEKLAARMQKKGGAK